MNTRSTSLNTCEERAAHKSSQHTVFSVIFYSVCTCMYLSLICSHVEMQLEMYR